VKALTVTEGGMRVYVTARLAGSPQPEEPGPGPKTEPEQELPKHVPDQRPDRRQPSRANPGPRHKVKRIKRRPTRS
jgi:hypothetical protein